MNIKQYLLSFYAEQTLFVRLIILTIVLFLIASCIVLIIPKQYTNDQIPEFSQIYIYRADLINQKDRQQVLQDAYVGQLLNFLPYSGYAFSMKYDYQTNQFLVLRLAGTTKQFTIELDSFLYKHHIYSRSWLHRLYIVTPTLTP